MTAKVVALGAAGEAAAGPVLAVAPPLLKAGVLTFEPLVGGRCMWVDASLGFPNQKVSDSASVIDPIVGGRIVWRQHRRTTVGRRSTPTSRCSGRSSGSTAFSESDGPNVTHRRGSL